jgi:peptidoglycan-associated lipoprotein
VAPSVKEILPEDMKGGGGTTHVSVASPPVRTLRQAGEPHPNLLDVPFDFDQYVLRADALEIVEANARRIKEDRPKRILLEGRGDEVGTAAYNLVLGERRAAQVMRYLEQLELTAASIDVMSYGKDRPLCLQHHAECRQKNRSVRFTVVE